MKLVVGVFLLSFLAYDAYGMEEQKKIVVFSCRGGGGHDSTTRALKDCLSNYNIDVIYLDSICNRVDLLKKLACNSFNTEDCYNFFLRNNRAGLASHLVNLTALACRWLHQLIVEGIYEKIRSDNIDCFISVIPLINGALLQVAKDLKIPFVVVTNDLDTTNYINDITSIDYDQFCYTLPFKDDNLFEKIIPARIPDHQIRIVGFPLRASFLERKDKNELKSEFGIAHDKKIVLILMGGNGSPMSYTYVQEFAKSAKQLHLIVCLGRNETLKKQIAGIDLPDNITMSVFGFTDRISDLMTISDVLITKPGPNSVCEAIASKLPIIVDKTQKTLWWEEMNVDFVKQHNLGRVLCDISSLEEILENVLEHAELIKEYMGRLQMDTFGDSIKKIISDLIALKEYNQ